MRRPRRSISSHFSTSRPSALLPSRCFAREFHFSSSLGIPKVPGGAVSTKTEIRVRMRTLRGAMSPAAVASASGLIQSLVLDMDVIEHCRTVLIYVSVANEVGTHRIIRELIRRKKRVVIPQVIDSARMDAHEIERWSDWRLGRWGIPSPVRRQPWHGEIDVCVLPGLAFSRRCDRLGFGKGHWDRFLELTPGATLIGLCHDWQVLDHLPTQTTDRPADFVITDRRVIERDKPVTPQ